MSKILLADGTDYKPVETMTDEELNLVAKALGLNRRNAKATRNEFRTGKIPTTHPTAVLLNTMKEHGFVNLFIDGRGLGKKDVRALKAGDMRAGRLVATVTKHGLDCFLSTVKKAKEAQDSAKEAAQARA